MNDLRTAEDRGTDWLETYSTASLGGSLLPSRKLPVGPWRLSCDAETFASLRSDKEFHFLVTLSRMILSLKAGIDMMVLGDSDDTQLGLRRRGAGFWLLAATLHEILEFDSKYRHIWGGLTVYVEAFKLFTPEALPKKERELLSTIRNRTAFHFDPTLPERVLPDSEPQPVTFIENDGSDRLASSYEMSELAAVSFVFGNTPTLDEMTKRFHPFLDTMKDLAVKFAMDAEDFLISRLLDRGFRFESTRKDSPPAATA